MTSLCFQSASHIAAQLDSRDLSAVECRRASNIFRRAFEQLSPSLSAIVVSDWDRARERARHADDALTW